MSANQEYLLIDHLDKTLQAEQLHEVEKLILTEKEFADQWGYLKLAVQGIEYAGLREQVAVISKVFDTETRIEVKSSPGIVRTLYRNVMRVAACLLLLVGSAAVYKYATLSSEGLYNKYYFSYDLNTSRGTGSVDQLEKAYREKNWAAVLKLSNSSVEKTNKSYFLAGMASMELKKYDLAIVDFQLVIALNEQSDDNYFQDEAEYYLAMSLIANNQINNATVILNKIKADKNHLYNKKVSDLSGLDLKIIQIKDGK